MTRLPRTERASCWGSIGRRYQFLCSEDSVIHIHIEFLVGITSIQFIVARAIDDKSAITIDGQATNQSSRALPSPQFSPRAQGAGQMMDPPLLHHRHLHCKQQETSELSVQLSYICSLENGNSGDSRLLLKRTSQQEPYRPSYATSPIVSGGIGSRIPAILWTCENLNDIFALTRQFHAPSLNPFGCIEIDAGCIASDADPLRTFMLHGSCFILRNSWWPSCGYGLPCTMGRTSTLKTVWNVSVMTN